MRMPAIAKEFLEDFISLIFPKICVHCNTPLVYQEAHLCTACRLSLPKTNFHLFHDNPLKQKFVFEPKVCAVASYIYFHKGGIAQSLIHELKYKGNKEVGEEIGRWYGHDLKESGWPVELIMPVPIHSSKERQRGYNQSYHFALGLAEMLECPVDSDSIKRVKRTATQTRKSKLARWINMEAVYTIADADAVKGKHVMVVDDVLTTGATLGELVSLLSASGVAAMYVVTIAAGK